MLRIYLKQTTGTYNAELDTVSITLTEEIHSTSNLFKKYKHTLQTATNGNIYIFNDTYRDCVTDGSNCLTITSNNGYQDDKLTEAHVYFNQYDTKNTPLLFVLIFNNGNGASVENKYSIWSKFNGKLTNGGQTVNINTLSRYGEDEKCILNDLLKENDKLPEPLTYQLEKKQGDSNGDSGNGKYNCGKIKVEDESGSEPKLSANGFKCYKHTPVNGDGNNGNKKACVIFDGNVLLGKNGDKNEVQGIQKEEYKCIRVYMGEKAKKESIVNGKKQIEVPLLIELNKKGDSDQPEYYVHKKSNSTSGTEYYWEKLPGKTGTVLCDLLTDMGLGMKSGEPGYNELQRLLTSAHVDCLEPDSGDLSNKLGQVTGTKLQNLLKEKVGDSGSAKPTLLVLLLRQIEFNLVDSVIVLLEKRDTDGPYGESQVTGVVSQLDPKREINRVSMSNGGGKNITVKDETDEKGTCVKKFGYKVVEHNFSTLVQDSGTSGQSHAGIRFIIPSENNHDKYKQLKLYNGDKTEPQNLEYQYYHKSGTNGGHSTSDSDKIYVWFYNGDKEPGKGDPRPLLLCYNNTTYAPKTKERYFTQWAKVNLGNGQGPTNECGCNGQETLSDEHNTLLKELDKVVKFLNKVDIRQVGSSNGQPHHYPVQTFKNQKIQIEVTCSKVGVTDSAPPEPAPNTCSTQNNTSCYKKFKHTPIGMTNGSATNGSGYRLGEVVYNGGGGGNPKGTLNYKTPESKHQYNPLVGVTVFYYDKDTDRKDPLLIELEFKTNGAGTGPKEYYKLQAQGDASNGEKKWELDGKAKSQIGDDDDSDNQKLVSYLDGIRHSLKPVMKILIDQQTEYPLCLSNDAGGTGDGYKQNNGKNVEVKPYTQNGCDKLAQEGYKCYEHKVSEITENGFDYNP